ncbi:MAG: glycosyltransferase family 4 protein [Tepidisphaeraceae bacterium]|jgi:glycosyltransferase involved in cell wall biosynthesis
MNASMTHPDPLTSSQPRLAYVSAVFPLASETFVYREVRGLRQRGWDVWTVSLNTPPPPRGDDDADLHQQRILLYGRVLPMNLIRALADLLAHPWRSLATLATALRDAVDPGEPMPLLTRLKLPLQAVVAIALARQLRRLGIAHLHCHFAHSPTTIGMYAAAQLGGSFSFTGHANDLFQRRCLLKRKLERSALVACISRWHRDWYESIQSDTRGKYEVIRCGVDTQVFHPTRAWKNFPVRRIVTVCRLVEKKGLDTLIRAIGQLLRRGIDAELIVAGDGPEAQKLHVLAKVSHCDRVQWLGEVDNGRIPAILADADIFALPCRKDERGDRDGIPVALIEAMACALPVVSGDLPAIRELIEDNVSGMLLSGDDPAALADILARLAAEERTRRRLGESGCHKVVEEFSLAMNLDRLEHRLEGIVRGPSLALAKARV